ncbi:MAG: GntR family transcriptional regulator [Clostridiaceae bacterium]|mgnify:CR=1 FL=1|nr:GntR family transcriptional regulator [Clostridiaceae bacterium]
MIIKVDLISEVPIYQQIRDQIVVGIANGKLEPGERLPSVRQLADDLGINHMTVNKAYTLLKQEGMLVSNRREGTKVAEQPLIELSDDYWQRLEVILSEGLSKTKNIKKFREKILNILKQIGG